MSSPRVEPASFRDPANQVFYLDGRVLRGLDDRAAADWRALEERGLYETLRERGLVATRVLPDEEKQGLPGTGSWALVLEHQRVPFVSYPYEWSFAMLRDAALLQLDLLSTALDSGTSMKDGYAYNVQWRGVHPAFVDIGSFEPTTGGPWAGYRQFCQTFLYPLMLQAYRDVAFQPFLRGAIEGITPEQMRNLLSFRDRFRRGVWKNVHLHEALSRRFAAQSARDVEREARSSGFSVEITKAMVAKLRKLVGRLEWKRARSTWSDYRRICSYSDADTTAKAAFVERAVASAEPSFVLDLGCNEGTFARIAARRAETVVAVDSDALVVDHLYRALREEGVDNVLPLVIDLTDPSPARGWRCVERKSFGERARADVVLALALVHHLAIAGNVPINEVAEWLRTLGGTVLVEVPHRDDPMVGRLLANKPAHLHDDYALETFLGAFAPLFRVRAQETLPGGTRTLVHLS